MDSSLKHIMIVEDNPGDVHLLVEMLNEHSRNQYATKHAERISHALQLLTEMEFDVLLLDLSLPDTSGLDAVRKVRSVFPNIPIIVLTGLEDDKLSVEALRIGAQDYLVKGQVSGPLLVRAMSHAIERKKMEERLNHLATHDSLTNLLNMLPKSQFATAGVNQIKQILQFCFLILIILKKLMTPWGMFREIVCCKWLPILYSPPYANLIQLPVWEAMNLC